MTVIEIVLILVLVELPVILFALVDVLPPPIAPIRRTYILYVDGKLIRTEI